MRKLIVFNNVSLDGYFTGANNDLSWSKPPNNDPELFEFVKENVLKDGILVFGRVTYEMMASYWPTPDAIKNDPIVAEGMNKRKKIVFSRKLQAAEWSNTTLVKGDAVSEIRKMKAEPGEDMAILGSGSIVSQLAQAGLIDEYQMLVNPIVLGEGRTMFEGVKKNLNLKLTSTRAFKNGFVLLCYEPVK
jgi:dihydrofolate reductase